MYHATVTVERRGPYWYVVLTETPDGVREFSEPMCSGKEARELAESYAEDFGVEVNYVQTF